MKGTLQICSYSGNKSSILTLFHCFEKKTVDVLQVTLRRKIWLLLSCDHKLIVLLKLAT